MKLAHLSDTHLGFSAYARTEGGRQNQREFDVCETFQRALDDIGKREPDLVVHSGDFFDKVRPSNFALIAAYRALSTFQANNGGKPFVIIGGNHDTPLRADSANILRLFDDIPGVRVATGRTQRIDVGGIDCLCVPHKSLESNEQISWAPCRPGRGVLIVHGLVDEVARKLREANFQFRLEDARAAEWGYVALGDWHTHQTFGPNICYAGSTDFTSSDIWGECAHPKGWVWFDDAVGQLEFVPLPTRPVIDLPPIDARDLTGPQLGDALAATTWAPEPAPIVRQRVLNAGPELRREWPVSTIRALEQRALRYLVQPSSAAAPGTFSTGERAPAETLEQAWGDHVDRIPVSGGVDRGALKGLGLDLLQEVQDFEVDPIEA